MLKCTFPKNFQEVKNKLLKIKVLTFSVLLLVISVIYLYTVAPGYTWSHFGFDAGNLLAAIKYWGIPHPPGFPIYLFLGKLFSLLIPFGDMAYRLNLMSVFFGMLTTLFVFLITYHITKHLASSFLTALTLAFAKTFWGQSLIAEVYTLNTFFLTLILFLVLKWEKRLRQWQLTDFKLFVFLALVFGLSLTNHLTIILIAPALALFVFWTLKKTKKLNLYCSPKKILTLISAFLFGLTPYLYIFLRARAKPLFNWRDPSTLERFWLYITGREFHQFFKPPASYLQTISQIIILFLENFTLPGLTIALFGLIVLLQRKKKIFGLTTLIFLATAVYNIHCQIDNIATYYLPCLVVIAFWFGFSVKTLFELLGLILNRANKRITTFPVFSWQNQIINFQQIILLLFFITLLTIPVSQFLNGLKFVSLRNDRAAATYGEDTIKAIDSIIPRENQKILIPDDEFTTFALIYYRYVIYPDREDIILLQSNGIYDSEYNFNEFKRLYPFLTFPEHPLGISTKSNTQGLLKFIKANMEKYPIFYAYPAPFPRWNEERQKFLEENVTLNSVGPIYYVEGSL